MVRVSAVRPPGSLRRLPSATSRTRTNGAREYLNYSVEREGDDPEDIIIIITTGVEHAAEGFMELIEPKS